MIHVTTSRHKAQDGYIRSLYVAVRQFRLLISWADSNWHTKGKPRKIPIFLNKHGLFVYRLAIRITKIRKEVE